MKIADYRRMAGLTQMELAQRLHVKHSTVCNWERGRHQPSAPLVPKLADALGISAREVIDAVKVAVGD